MIMCTNMLDCIDKAAIFLSDKCVPRMVHAYLHLLNAFDYEHIDSITFQQVHMR